MTLSSCFIEPLDVLFLRGNQLFGEPGSYGQAQMPPWPSLAAGALRSRILADDAMDLAAFAAGKLAHPTLGTPAAPGAFTLHAFQLAQRTQDDGIEIIMPLPADLVVSNQDGSPPRAAAIRALTLHKLHPQLATSAPLELLPVLAQAERSKAASGWWLRAGGWRKYLQGKLPVLADLVHGSSLWQLDERIGIGLQAATRSAADGQLFTNSAVAMHAGVGFAAAVSGAELPAGGLLRLGGDGRAARLQPADVKWPAADHAAIATAGRCRIVLTSPGIFAGGWQLPGLGDDGRLQLPGLSARVVAAAVARADTVSGWDLAQRQPKPAQKTAASGSVYWLQDVQASTDALGKLAERGLWLDPCEDEARRAEGEARRAEGYNRFCFAAW